MSLYDFVDENVSIDVDYESSQELDYNEYDDVDKYESTDDDLHEVESLSSIDYEEIIPDDFNIAGDYQETELDIIDSNSHADHIEDVEKNEDTNRAGTISFKGNGRCRVCGCGKWAGYGDTCANCGHFYNKHI